MPSLVASSIRFFLSVVLLLSVAPSVEAQARALKPGDALLIRVYREPELSGEYQINELGVVTIPRLGELRILDWPLDSIRPRLQRQFAAYLREPTVEVAFLRRVTIYGSVMKPGLYPVDPTMTVQDALALAGGPSLDGMRDRVELIRGGTRVVQRLGVGTAIDQTALESGDQLFVPQRSWIARNTWLVSTLIGAAATITAIIVSRT